MEVLRSVGHTFIRTDFNVNDFYVPREIIRSFGTFNSVITKILFLYYKLGVIPIF